jgi:hypothetical protein
VFYFMNPAIALGRLNHQGWHLRGNEPQPGRPGTRWRHGANLGSGPLYAGRKKSVARACSAPIESGRRL